MMKKKLLWAIVWIHIVTAVASAQNLRAHRFHWRANQRRTGSLNGTFERIDVQNGISYGLAAGYLLGDRASIEFLWNYNKADTVAEPRGGGTDTKAVQPAHNQYFG